MQEILYRGYSKTKKAWIVGLPRYYQDKIHSIQTKYGTEIQVDPETVSQYIGIKDIHQKKVFSGDIVKVKRFIFTDCSREEVEGMEEYTGEVIWWQFGWHIAEKTETGTTYHSMWLWNIKEDESDPDTHFMEIIGDRYNNPEMKVIE